MTPLGIGLYFGNPVFLGIGIICTWLVLFFPFALYCQHAARNDVFSGLEAYLIGQCAGPVGVWLILRANRKAELKAKQDHYVREAVREIPDDPPDVVEPPPGGYHPQTMPGGQAWRAPHDPDHSEAPPGTVEMQRSDGQPEAPPPPEEPHEEKEPFEPQEVKIKAGDAYRPPPKPGRPIHRQETKMDTFSLPEDVAKPGNGASRDD